MKYDNLLLELTRGIAVVTLNRPKALNALNEATLKELQSAFSSLATDPVVKVVIITGNSEKAFVAGADIAAMQGWTLCRHALSPSLVTQ